MGMTDLWHQSSRRFVPEGLVQYVAIDPECTCSYPKVPCHSNKLLKILTQLHQRTTAMAKI